MSPEQDAKDEGTGFETSAELRHGETFPAPRTGPPTPTGYRPRRTSAFVVLGLVIVLAFVVIYIVLRVL